MLQKASPHECLLLDRWHPVTRNRNVNSFEHVSIKNILLTVINIPSTYGENFCTPTTSPQAVTTENSKYYRGPLLWITTSAYWSITNHVCSHVRAPGDAVFVVSSEGELSMILSWLLLWLCQCEQTTKHKQRVHKEHRENRQAGDVWSPY